MKKNKKDKKIFEKKLGKFSLPEEVKKKIGGVIIFLLAIIIGLSFFEAAGKAGQFIFSFFHFLIGKTVFLLPLILVFSGLVIFLTPYKKILFAEILAIFLLILGISGIFANLTNWSKGFNGWGGWLGDLIAKPFFQLFGFWVSQIIFAFLILISGIIFRHLFLPPSPSLEKQSEKEEKKPLVSRVFKKVFEEPSFKIKEIETAAFEELKKEKEITKEPSLELKTESIDFINKSRKEYQPPSLELLDSEKSPTPGGGLTATDIRINSAIIKKTLENFEIPVEMSEVNVGPTVTQYTLKPAQGIKLSKITTLSNDLALALASHPIRIEAPIPGKSLVGIEVPNKIRTQVRLRDLLANPQFQNSLSNLTFALGKDVSGVPIYADLARMPHLLISGSTGTGKTIMINSLILSLIYRNSPEILRFILIDPKRVEFSIYKQLPHLLLPVIFDAQKTVNTLKWLIMEMERRFDILSDWGKRDIIGYNQEALRQEQEPLPYIVFIIDELADLMASRPREIEAGIVRLAQMARAVGIHLVVSTQRPSVEVITGLIKANITSRIAFQVASQVDSRTILDMAGAEKLLGSGDMLFVSTEVLKPKRIQGAYVTEKEIKRVVNWVKSKITFPLATQLFPPSEEILEQGEGLSKEMGFDIEEDSLYPEAEKVVREAKKASASLLQRKLRIGYARAARLIDIMEKKGLVGPGEGAKPREVYIDKIQNSNYKNQTEKDNEWQKI
jgi:S-DNA-T family DNA segregation ATPase FtsK/SpoIIIE